jgi:hypothetical protein
MPAKRSKAAPAPQLPPGAQSFYSARYLQLVSETIVRSKSHLFRKVPAPTWPEELALELVLQFLNQRKLTCTKTTAKSESLNSISTTHPRDWTARQLALTMGGSSLTKLCRIQAVPPPLTTEGPRFTVVSSEGNIVVGRLARSEDAVADNEFRLEDEVEEDVLDDGEMLGELRKLAVMEEGDISGQSSQDFTGTPKGAKHILSRGFEFLELSEDPTHEED